MFLQRFKKYLIFLFKPLKGAYFIINTSCPFSAYFKEKGKNRCLIILKTFSPTDADLSFLLAPAAVATIETATTEIVTTETAMTGNATAGTVMTEDVTTEISTIGGMDAETGATGITGPGRNKNFGAAFAAPFNSYLKTFIFSYFPLIQAILLMEVILLASYVSPELQNKFETLSIDLKNTILERNVHLENLHDLIAVLEDIVKEAEGN